MNVMQTWVEQDQSMFARQGCPAEAGLMGQGPVLSVLESEEAMVEDWLSSRTRSQEAESCSSGLSLAAAAAVNRLDVC